MKPTLEQVLAFANTDLVEEPIPGPYQIALTLAAAMLSGNGFADDRGAAVETAWMLVMPFYQGRRAYETNTKMLYDLARHASAPEGPMNPGEARAYVTGGETGGIGEGQGETMTISAFAQTPEQMARNTKIAEATMACQAAYFAWMEAKEGKDEALIQTTFAAYEAAAKVQSEAYL